MNSAFQFSVDNEGIAHIVFNLPGEKVNKLSIPILEELEKLLDNAAQNKEIKALAISSAKPEIFIAGADLHAFEPIFKDPSSGGSMIETGHRVFNKLENLPFPSIALINGACLGGGLELALTCSYRVVSDHPKTQLGLPEVTLGIIPGWGGTQRLPRRIGLLEGLPMLLSGKPVKAAKAYKIKLADAIIPAEFFDVKAKAFIKQIITEQGRQQISNRRKFGGLSHWLLESNPLGRSFIYHQARKDVLKRTKGHYPAPLIALDLVKETYTLPLQQGLTKEIETFKNNLPTGFLNAKNLIALFFINEALKKDTGVPSNIKPQKIESAGVVGAGTMGSGIAWLFSYRDIPIRMKDIDWNAVGKGFGSANAIYTKMVKEKKLKPNEASLKFHHISGTIDYSGFKNLDYIVEAAVESLELKHKIIRELENIIKPNTIIASNTSSLKIADIGAVMLHPERLVGMHFFNPANRMPLVEVIASDKTSPEAIATAVEISRKLGKTPIVVKDCPGFLVNRILIASLNETMRMYEESGEAQKLESMMLDFGMPMSPFILADEVGNDISYKVGKVFEQAYGNRMAMPKILEILYQNQLFGKKSGKGFYLYDGDKKKGFNPQVEQLRASIVPNTKSLSETEMRDRAILSMVNEAARCLEENIVADPAHLDMAMIMGTGFPPFHGGLLRYADSLGINYIVDQLKNFQHQYGERFTPCQRLIEMQNSHKTFF